MEKSSVLIVLKCIVDFLVPYYSSIPRGYVHQLEPKRVSDRIIREHGSSLEPGVGPSIAARMRNVESSDSDSLNLVRGFGNSTLDSLPVSVAEEAGHIGGLAIVDYDDLEDGT